MVEDSKGLYVSTAPYVMMAKYSSSQFVADLEGQCFGA